jgi:hypothetical protein
MTSAYFDDHVFDLAKAKNELAAFKALLASTTGLGERKQVLANFAMWPQLCALFGTFHPTLNIANLVRRELTVGHHFIADLGVRRSGSSDICLVEFEGASDHDIFSAHLAKRKVHPWATKMEKGFSQIVDWAWALDTYRDTPDFKDAFGSSRPKVMGVLVIGRTTSLSDNTRRDRWDWRSRWFKPPGLDGVQLKTYDELYEYFDIQLKILADLTSPVAPGTL